MNRMDLLVKELVPGKNVFLVRSYNLSPSAIQLFKTTGELPYVEFSVHQKLKFQNGRQPPKDLRALKVVSVHKSADMVLGYRVGEEFDIQSDISRLPHFCYCTFASLKDARAYAADLHEERAREAKVRLEWEEDIVRRLRSGE